MTEGRMEEVTLAKGEQKKYYDQFKTEIDSQYKKGNRSPEIPFTKDGTQHILRASIVNDRGTERWRIQIFRIKEVPVPEAPPAEPPDKPVPPPPRREDELEEQLRKAKEVVARLEAEKRERDIWKQLERSGAANKPRAGDAAPVAVIIRTRGDGSASSKPRAGNADPGSAKPIQPDASKSKPGPP